MTQEVAELALLRREVAAILLGARRADRHALLHAETVALEAHDLARIVGHRTDRLEAEVEEDLRADAVVAEVGLEAERFVGLHRVRARVLQLVRAELVEEPDAASFLV